MNSFIDKMIQQLDYNLDKDTQQKAITFFVDNDSYDISILIQPNGKECWENAAKVLEQKEYESLKPITFKLFRWLEDLTCPGAWRIMDLLNTFPVEDFIEPYEKIIETAVDYDWQWLEFLTYYIHNGKITENDFKNKENYAIAKKHMGMWQ